MLRKKFASLAALLVLVTGLTACREDCDAEDRRNRERECVDTRNTKPAVKQTPAKPKPPQKR